MNQLLVTGIPRSGTTLVTAIIDGLRDTIALSEPAAQATLWKTATNETAYVEAIADSFAALRADILAGRGVRDYRTRDGSPVTDYLSTADGAAKLDREEVEVCPRGLTENFLLACKQNAHFTSILPQLCARRDFAALAVVRDPVRTILSWQSVPFPISKGRLPAGEAFWPELKAVCEGPDALLTRQAKIIELFFARYLALSDSLILLRYEDLIVSPGLVSSALHRSQVRMPDVRRDMKARPGAVSEARIMDALDRHAPSVFALYPDLAATYR